MSGSQYADFRIEFSKAADGYDVSFSSSAGDLVQRFVLPFSDDELASSTRELLTAGDAMAVAKRIGTRLFEALFQGEALATLKSALDHAPSPGVRLMLRFRDAPELAALPWELLYRATTDSFFALSGATPVVRYVELPDPVRALAVAPPLAILGVVSSPADAPELDVEREQRKLLEALKTSARGDLIARGAVAVDWLEDATLPGLQAMLRKRDYHVLHFIGHGAADAAEGVLLFLNESKAGHRVTGSELGTLLHDERTLRLVVLNACEGAKAPGADRFSAAALALVRQGVPAVVAMQFVIGDEAAIAFARELYAALADGTPLEVALAEARRAVFARHLGAEWATPVLFSRLPESDLFEIAVRDAPKSSPHVSRITPARIAIVVAALGAIAGAVLIGQQQCKPTEPPPTSSSTSPSAPPSSMQEPPELLIQHVFPLDRIERKDLEVDLSKATQEQGERFLSLQRVAFGRLPSEEATGYDIRIKLENTTDDFMTLDLHKGYFAFEDAQGRAAEMLYFCCEDRDGTLPKGSTREIQIIFRSRPEWGGKNGVSQAFVKVEGFLPVVRESWQVALPVTAD